MVSLASAQPDEETMAEHAAKPTSCFNKAGADPEGGATEIEIVSIVLTEGRWDTPNSRLPPYRCAYANGFAG